MKRLSIFLTVSAVILFGGVSSYALFAQQNCRVYVLNTWNGCAPIIETAGVISTDKYSAVVQAFFNSNNADYTIYDYPELGIEFGPVKDGDFKYVTKLEAQLPGATNRSFLLNGLTEGETYMYRAVLYWVGGVEYGTTKEFVAGQKKLGSGGSVTSTETSSTTTTSTNSSNSQSVGSQINLSPFGNLFSNKPAQETKKTIYKQTDEKSGFRLAIDNGESLIRQGDIVTTKVRYENNNTRSSNNATVEIFFPKEYSVDSTNKGIVDRVGNKIVVSIDEFPAGGYGTIIATARATGRLGTIDQVLTQATLTVGSVKLAVTDADEYGEGNIRKTQNSVSGANFVPGTLIGWIFLLIILALIVVIGRRYFIKKDY